MSREAHTIHTPAIAGLYEGMTAAGILNAFAGRVIGGPDADGFADVIGSPD